MNSSASSSSSAVDDIPELLSQQPEASTTTTSAAADPAPASVLTAEQLDKRPTVCLVIGMAGSGKTTFMHRVNSYVQEKQIDSYFINLDPAVTSVPFAANIDIRDTVNYKEVMKQYSLGPNGGILTALNLFATRFDQVVKYIENKADKLKYVFIDTPGQIEIFTWSASGQIITETLASLFRTVVIYIIDTPRTTVPLTFMSNMLYACSILYKMRLPFLLVFNKTDVAKHDFAIEWMDNFEAFQLALGNNDQTYSTSLAYSMSLVLDQFYKNLRHVGFSAVTGKGSKSLFNQINDAAKEYDDTYLKELEKRKELFEVKKEKERLISMKKLEQDMQDSKKGTVVIDAKKQKRVQLASKSLIREEEELAKNAELEDIDEEYNAAEQEELEKFLQTLNKQKKKLK